MKVALRELPEGHSRIDREVPAEDLDLGSWLTAKGPARVGLDADKRDQQITLRGKVRIQSDQSCARCLAPVVAELEGDVLILADRRGSDDASDEQVLEQEGSVLYHDGTELNLADTLREVLILEVSQVVLCREDCLGLCSQCGRDRNRSQCQCGPETEDPRWQVLEELKKSGSNPKA